MSSRAIRSFEAVTPEEYLVLAMELAQSPDVASRRSAVDRAYYAAFLAARNELESKRYISVTSGPGVHGQVANALRRIDEDASRMLIGLRQARNRLTYQTSSTSLLRGQSIPELLDSARAVMEAVQALPRNSP